MTCSSPYTDPAPSKRVVRHIYTRELRTPNPAVQPALDFDPPQPAVGELSIDERFAAFHAANPQVYRALRKLALAEAERGARRISAKLLFEQLRAAGGGVAQGEEPYRLNNIFTSRYARLLASEPGLVGRIETRKLLAA